MEELELIREDELANELIIEGEFLSEKQMLEEWHWPQTLLCYSEPLKSDQLFLANSQAQS